MADARADDDQEPKKPAAVNRPRRKPPSAKAAAKQPRGSSHGTPGLMVSWLGSGSTAGSGRERGKAPAHAPDVMPVRQRPDQEPKKSAAVNRPRREPPSAKAAVKQLRGSSHGTPGLMVSWPGSGSTAGSGRERGKAPARGM